MPVNSEDEESPTPGDMEMERMRLKLAVLEAEMKLMKAKEKERQRLGGSEQEPEQYFNITKAANFVPKFTESDPDRYFSFFEKTALEQGWPKQKWATLVRTQLVGKGFQRVETLEGQDFSDYDKIKEEVLLAYQMIPEKYRQKFRNQKFQDGQTLTEFGNEKLFLFKKWVCSKGVNKDYNKLVDLMVHEELYNTIPVDLREYLEDKNPDNLSEALDLGDRFLARRELVSKNSHAASENFPTHSKPYSKSYGHKGKWDKNFQEQMKAEVPYKIEGKGKSAGVQSLPRQSDNVSGPRVNSTSPTPNGKNTFKSYACYYCNKTGHTQKFCWSRRRDQEREEPPQRTLTAEIHPVACIRSSRQGEEEPLDLDPRMCIFSSRSTVGLQKDVGRVENILSLRDGCSTYSLLRAGVLPVSKDTYTGVDILLKGITGSTIRTPVHKLWVESAYQVGYLPVGISDEIPFKGVDLLLGNNVMGLLDSEEQLVWGKPNPKCWEEMARKTLPDLLPDGSTMRSMAHDHATNSLHISHEDGEGLSLVTLLSDVELQSTEEKDVPARAEHDWRMDQLNNVREAAPARVQLISVQENVAVAEEEILQLNKCFHFREETLTKNSPLFAVSMEGEQGFCPQMVMSKVSRHFFWSQLWETVREYIETYHVFQFIGKPSLSIKPVPLQSISAPGEPFSKLVVDVLGPFPRTKLGNDYLLTNICSTTRYLEAVPLHKITAHVVLRVLMKFFFHVCFPQAVQEDQGPNFTSKPFRNVLKGLKVEPQCSTVYHSPSQGEIEKLHQTLKTMMPAYGIDNTNNWDERIPFFVFAEWGSTGISELLAWGGW
ncbi:uncharacterized protein [Cherax quadricarinatus]|uniref:uncharacterized protein n=1 Tax=Cherax quadricarinatus TaxID=27406 RepID=UPI00387E2CA2